MPKRKLPKLFVMNIDDDDEANPTMVKAHVADLIGQKDGNIILTGPSGLEEVVAEEGDTVLLIDGYVLCDKEGAFHPLKFNVPAAYRTTRHAWLRSVRNWNPTLMLAVYQPTHVMVNYSEVRLYQTDATNAQFKAGNILFYEKENVELLAYRESDCLISLEGDYWNRKLGIKKIAYERRYLHEKGRQAKRHRKNPARFT